MPEAFGKRTNAVRQAYRVEHVAGRVNEKKTLQTSSATDLPFARRNELVELVTERQDRESEIKILEDKLRNRLCIAAELEWVPPSLRVE